MIEAQLIEPTTYSGSISSSKETPNFYRSRNSHQEIIPEIASAVQSPRNSSFHDKQNPKLHLPIRSLHSKTLNIIKSKGKHNI